MKKLIGIIFMLCMTVSLFSACGEVEPEVTETTETTAVTSETAAATTAETTAVTTTETAATTETATDETAAETTTARTTVAITESTVGEPSYSFNSVCGMPGLYRLPIEEAEGVEDAAIKLTVQMLDAMKAPDPIRSFCITEYKDVSVRLEHSFVAYDYINSMGMTRNSQFIADNIWFVDPHAQFRFTGIYAPIGPNIDESHWWEPLYQGGRIPMVLLKTESEYLMWWSNADQEYPEELFEHSVTVDPDAGKVNYDIRCTRGLYTVPVSEVSDWNEAAEILCTQLLDAMKEPAPNRTFCITEYEDMAVSLTTALEASRNLGDGWHLPFVFPEFPAYTWIIEIEAKFQYTGVYAPFGVSDGQWHTLCPERLAPLIMTKTEDTYVMAWCDPGEWAPELLPFVEQ